MINPPPGSKLYLDANVFIYAAETPSAFTGLMAVLHRLDQGDYVAVTSALTLAEVLVMPIRSGNAALELAYRAMVSNSVSLTVIDVSRDILLRAATIRAITTGVKLPDAIHAASSEAAGCTHFLTNDIRLKSIIGLPVTPVSELG
jgi:predicted nucleic acid-binding protein